MEQIENQEIQNGNQTIKQDQTQEFKFDFDQIANNSVNYPQKDMKHHTISIAPMLDVTNPHWRFLYRLVSRHSTLYTEMIHANNLLFQQDSLNQERNQFYPCEHPIVFQLGGSDPEALGKAAKLVEELGYDEINLNCGCPSAKVQCGSFGACLMKEPELVGECMKQIQNAVSIPCSVKHRIGVDDQEDYEFTKGFVECVNKIAGITHFQAHARKAYLKGLNPDQNRNIPPLNYDFVKQLANDFPKLDFSINGGFKSYQQVQDILKPENKLIGCMIGRWAQENVWNMNDMDRKFYGQPNPTFSRREMLKIYGEYGNRHLERYPNSSITKLVNPLIPLFAGERHNAQYKRFLGGNCGQVKSKYSKFSDFLEDAIDYFDTLNKEALDERPPVNEEEAQIQIQKYQEIRKQQEKSNANQKPIKLKTSKFQKKLEKKLEKKQKKFQMQQQMEQQSNNESTNNNNNEEDDDDEDDDNVDNQNQENQDAQNQIEEEQQQQQEIQNNNNNQNMKNQVIV